MLETFQRQRELKESRASLLPTVLNVEAEVQHVALADEVFLAF